MYPDNQIPPAGKPSLWNRLLQKLSSPGAPSSGQPVPQQPPEKKPPAIYVLTGEDGVPLARGILTSPPDAINMQIVITDGNVNDVVTAETLEAVPESDEYPMRLVRVILRRRKLVVLEPLKELHSSMRENLRMPVEFHSFVYPLSGGRARIRSLDLSCGGIAFYTDYRFSLREQFEVVIPITEVNPLIVRAEILRQNPHSGLTLYAAKFVDLIHDEECRIREAVFRVQLSGR